MPNYIAHVNDLNYGNHHMADGQFMGSGMWLWILLWAFVVGLVSIVFIALVKSKIHDDSNPIDIVKERYAKGEISKKEYEELRKELK